MFFSGEVALKFSPNKAREIVFLGKRLTEIESCCEFHESKQKHMVVWEGF
jgi:hypothetical protein